MPSGFNLTPEPESILISWSNDGCPSSFNPEEFFIRINEEPFIRVISTQSSYTVPDLTPFTNYTFVIILKCQNFLGSQVLNTDPSSPIEGATEQGSKYILSSKCKFSTSFLNIFLVISILRT